MQKFITYAIATITLLTMGFGIVHQVRAEEYEEPTQQEEQQEQAPSVDTSNYVQVADPALYAKLDNLQESVDKLVDALAPAETDETTGEEQPKETPAPDYSAQLATISDQLSDIAQQSTAETAEPAAFDKPFADYATSEVLSLLLLVGVLFIVYCSIINNFIL